MLWAPVRTCQDLRGPGHEDYAILKPSPIDSYLVLAAIRNKSRAQAVYRTILGNVQGISASGQGEVELIKGP